MAQLNSETQGQVFLLPFYPHSLLFRASVTATESLQFNCLQVGIATGYGMEDRGGWSSSP
jgi:hypothetical protein